MNKKVSLGICISLVIIAITATFAITMVVSGQIYNGIVSDISQRSGSIDSVVEINEIVRNYYYGDIEDNNKLNSALARGFVNGLDDSNSIYLDASEYAAYEDKLEGGIKGVGVETAFNYQTGHFVITHVYDGSPAKNAGLKEHDVISAIGDNAVTMTNYAKLRDMLYGDKLTTVKIEYERDGATKVVEPMLGFSIPSVSGRLESNVGYIRISGFYKNTAEEFRKAAESLVEQGAESMIFDVRNTSAGTIDYAAQVIDVIVPVIHNGNIAVIKDRNGGTYKNKVYTAEKNSITMPFIVLVNSYTSGPAELFACDLRDISQAQIIGTQTAGVGTMQELFPLDDGGAVLLTVALVEPKGGADAVYHLKGITPTKEVSLLSGDDLNIDLLEAKDDNQLQTALNMLSA